MSIDEVLPPGPPPAAAAHPVVRAVVGVEAAARELVGLAPWGLLDGEVLDCLATVDRAQRALAAARLGLVAEADGRGAAAKVGAVDTASWLRSRLGVAPGAARQQLRLALASRDGDELAPVRDALAAAGLSGAHADVVERTLRHLPPSVDRAQRADAVGFLVEQAAVLDAGELGRAALHLRHLLAPAPGEQDEDAARRRRELHLVDGGDGTVVLRGRFDPVGAETITAALEAATDAPPSAEARDVDPGDAHAATPARRRADALVRLAQESLAAPGAPRRHGERPRVVVTMDLETLLGDLARRAHTDDLTRLHDVLRTGGRVASPAPAVGVRGAWLRWWGPVSATAARALACDAEVLPAVLSGAGEVLDLGRSRRTVSRGLRRALEVRDRGCVFPGCDRPVVWTDVHHGVHWADGGDTSLGNCALSCERHHHGPLHHGWTLRVDADNGLPYVVPPRWVDPDQVPRLHHRFRPLRT